MKIISLIALVLSVMLLGCGRASGPSTLDTDARLLAYLQCEARQLKERRFQVATEMRFREDSLHRLHQMLTELQQHRADSVKRVLTKQTQQLASRITQTMDSLFALHYHTVEQRRALDAATERLVAEVCH